jgi:hypothetical protein
LAPVVYAAAVVFEGSTVTSEAVDEFMRSGSRGGPDLPQLEDLRGAAWYLGGHTREPVTAPYVRDLNAAMTRTAALHPGELRTADQQIGVTTALGRHTPQAVTEAKLQRMIAAATASPDVREKAIDLFVSLAAAQPF